MRSLSSDGIVMMSIISSCNSWSVMDVLKNPTSPSAIIEQTEQFCLEK